MVPPVSHCFTMCLAYPETAALVVTGGGTQQARRVLPGYPRAAPIDGCVLYRVVAR